MGRQRPSPGRTPTGTSRRVGSGQGDLLHTRETTSASRMQGVSIEQPCCLSLSKWRERTTLLHRHAGMSTGSEPCTLRGILSKGAWALMRLGPSHEEGPMATAPHWTNMSKWVFSSHTLQRWILPYVHCVISSGLWSSITYITRECCKVFHQEEDKSMVGAVAQYYMQVSNQLVQCSYQQGSGPNVICTYNMTTSRRQSPTSVIPWKLKKSSVLWTFLYPDPTLHTLRLVTLGMPRDIPYCPVHSIPFRRLPNSPEGLPYGQGLPHSSPSIPYLQEQSIPKNVQHTQQCTKGLDYKTENIASQQRA